MRVIVIGAGIVGVTTAYEMAALGHQVTVLDRCGSVAAEASFANAGVIAPAYVAPWAAPGMPRKVLRQFFGGPGAVQVGAGSALARLPWLWRAWRACRPAVHRDNRVAMQRLAQFSRDRLLELTRTLHLDYEQMPGFTVLLRSERELKALQPALALLRELGVAHELVDAARCRQIEPGLHADTPLHAALHLPQDGVGNCRHFAHLLKAQAQRLGADFRFDTEARALRPGSQPVVELGDGKLCEGDAVVVCAGVQAPALLRSVGLKLPLAAVHGYSVTAPVRHFDGAAPVGPRAALVDERYRVAITRLGQRIRVAGGAEIGGSVDVHRPAALARLYRVLDDWFPGAALTREAQHWKGTRPMLPDGPPVLGPSGAPGVWLNLGHGASGWTLASGSARVLAELVSGREAPLDLARLTAARLR